MHWEQNTAVNPRCYRNIVCPILRAGHALKDKAIPRAIFLRCQQFLILPEELALYHVFIGEVCSTSGSFQRSNGNTLATFSPGSIASIVMCPLTVICSRRLVFSGPGPEISTSRRRPSGNQ